MLEQRLNYACYSMHDSIVQRAHTHKHTYIHDRRGEKKKRRKEKKKGEQTSVWILKKTDN